ncbi:MAG: AsmA-like C-terminal domain-containing protein, partial [Alphaproteobacteria bacterium]|nr:AsmA-like C-terminal domain-containing protein [Alphaproteobacteria bacterium]
RVCVADAVALDEPLLAFDAKRGGLVLSGTKLSIEKNNETHLLIENFSISASPEAVLDKFIFAPHTLEAENVTAIFLAENIQRTGQIAIQTEDKVETANEFDPAAAFSALQNRLAQTHFIGRGRDYLDYLQTIKLPNVTLAFRDYNDKDDKIWHSAGSYILFDRLNDKINANLHFELHSGRERSVLEFTLSQPFAESGEALLRVNNIRLSTLGLFLPNLPFLAQADVPVNGAIAFFTNAEGAFIAGATDFQLSKGTIQIGDEVLAVRTAKMQAKVDFVSNNAAVETIDFHIGPHKGKLQGSVDFDLNAQNQLILMDGRLSAEEMNLALSKTGDVFNPDNLELGFEIDLIEERLDLTRVEFTSGGGLFSFGSEITYNDPTLPIILSGEVKNLPADGLKKLWPSTIARGVHDWFNKNIHGGLMSVGTLNMQTSIAALRDLKKGIALPSQALDFVIEAENAEIHYYKDLPPARNVTVQLVLAGNRFDAYIKRGEVIAPDNSIISIKDGKFSAPDFHIRGNDGQIEIALEGRISAFLQMLDLPDLNLLQRFKLDSDIIDGYANGNLQISVPLTRRLPKQVFYNRIRVDVDAQFIDFALRDKFKNYKIDGKQIDFKLNREQFHAEGEIRLNNVPFKIDWLEYFSPTQSPRTIISLDAVLDEKQFANLSLNWPSRHIRGPVPTRVELRGKLEAFDLLSLRADLTQAQVNMSPIAYDKPVGEAASVELDLRFINKNQLVAFDMAIENENVNIKAALEFDNQLLTALHIAPLQIPNAYDAEIHLTQNNGARQLRIIGKQFDISRMLKSQEFGAVEVEKSEKGEKGVKKPPPAETDKEKRDNAFSLTNMLGENIDIKIAIDRAAANNGIILNGLKGELIRRDAHFERVFVNAEFADESPFDFQLVRENAKTRYLSLNVPIAEHFFKGIDRIAGMKGGRLLLLGEIEDGAQVTGNGRLYVADFNVRDVPTLAKILSLGSLTGIADTLTGEGIAFRQAEIRYRFNEQLFEIEDMRINGPAVGLTLEGIIDRRADHIYMDGTLVPAYGINSFLGKIPLIGSLFSGGRGGGLLGLSYNVEGALDDPEVKVNPLSLFTPGFLRNIFKLRLFGPKMPKNVRSFGDSRVQ